MEKLENILRKMDFNFFGSGQHTIGMEKAARLIGKKDRAIFLDVRTPEEVNLLPFPFALHIPVNELPERLNELPKDKLIIIFCSSIVRAAIVYPYLLAKGFDEVKILHATTENLVSVLKPGPIYKRQQN